MARSIVAIEGTDLFSAVRKIDLSPFGVAGAFEREAIRPHVLGRFAELLLAVERHPAMLLYLDNHLSIGPNSRAAGPRARRLKAGTPRRRVAVAGVRRGVHTVPWTADRGGRS